MDVANTGRVVDDKPKVLRRLALAPVGYRPAELCANAGGREQKEETTSSTSGVTQPPLPQHDKTIVAYCKWTWTHLAWIPLFHTIH